MFQQWKKLANDMSTTEGSYSSEEEQKICLTKPRALLEVLNNSVFNSSTVMIRDPADWIPMLAFVNLNPTIF